MGILHQIRSLLVYHNPLHPLMYCPFDFHPTSFHVRRSYSSESTCWSRQVAVGVRRRQTDLRRNRMGCHQKRRMGSANIPHGKCMGTWFILSDMCDMIRSLNVIISLIHDANTTLHVISSFYTIHNVMYLCYFVSCCLYCLSIVYHLIYFSDLPLDLLHTGRIIAYFVVLI